MTHSSLAAHFSSALFEFLDETFETHHGFYLDKGTSLFETLSTVSATEASQPVSASCASIAAQVNHVTYLSRRVAVGHRGQGVRRGRLVDCLAHRSCLR